jgi:hypothetical protein
MRLASGMVRAPMIGTKTVRSVIVSMFILKAKYIFFRRGMSRLSWREKRSYFCG